MLSFVLAFLGLDILVIMQHLPGTFFALTVMLFAITLKHKSLEMHGLAGYVPLTDLCLDIFPVCSPADGLLLVEAQHWVEFAAHS